MLALSFLYPSNYVHFRCFNLDTLIPLEFCVFWRKMRGSPATCASDVPALPRPQPHEGAGSEGREAGGRMDFPLRPGGRASRGGSRGDAPPNPRRSRWTRGCASCARSALRGSCSPPGAAAPRAPPDSHGGGASPPALRPRPGNASPAHRAAPAAPPAAAGAASASPGTN